MRNPKVELLESPPSLSLQPALSPNHFVCTSCLHGANSVSPSVTTQELLSTLQALGSVHAPTILSSIESDVTCLARYLRIQARILKVLGRRHNVKVGLSLC